VRRSELLPVSVATNALRLRADAQLLQFGRAAKLHVLGKRSFVYQQKDADHYDVIRKIPTPSCEGTSFWSPELNRFYVTAPGHGNEDAAILVFESQP
jgi:hypothetical protein